MRKISKHYLFFALILFLTFLLRFPSLYEPFWYGDEGIFAAVATNLNQGGVLYQTAWDNKPPMIFLTYASIFKLLGVSMFSLRLVTIVVVLATSAAIYEIANHLIGQRRALIASLVFGILSSLRIVEGNLSLTEVFMILPISLAMMFVIVRKFDYLSVFSAGFLIAVASLYKQVGVLEAAALGIFLFLYSKNSFEFIKKGVVLSLGFSIPFTVTISYFAQNGILNDYLFAAYFYYQIYFEESPQRALLINVLKLLPILAAVSFGVLKKLRGKAEVFHLVFLWCAFSFLGSYFSGRAYGHYLVQVLPALSILVASISFKIKMNGARVAFFTFFFVPLIILTQLLFTDFLSGGPINQIKYYKNFVGFASGSKSTADYNNFFDGNVNRVVTISDFFNTRKNFDGSAYIWGDLPWLYAAGNLENPVRYVTSFHVFGVPTGKAEVITSLAARPPTYIIKTPQSIGYFAELEKLLAEKYTLVSNVESVQVHMRKVM